MLPALAVAALLLAGPALAGRPPLPQDTACRPGPMPRGLREEPTFTPFTRAPELNNRDEIRAALAALYPAQLKARGESGATTVWALVDPCGRVAETRVRLSSGQELFDSAALRIARLMRFLPGLQGQWPVNAWVQLPILFGNPPYPLPKPVPIDVRPEVGSDALPRLWAPAGYVGPSLLNAGELQAQLAAGYAALEGRGRDSVLVALHIDPQGRVMDARVATSSGSPRLDALALDVARRAFFVPAVDPRRRYCSLWTTLPLRFAPQR